MCVDGLQLGLCLTEGIGQRCVVGADVLRGLVVVSAGHRLRQRREVRRDQQAHGEQEHRQAGSGLSAALRRVAEAGLDLAQLRENVSVLLAEQLDLAFQLTVLLCALVHAVFECLDVVLQLVTCQQLFLLSQ